MHAPSARLRPTCVSIIATPRVKDLSIKKRGGAPGKRSSLWKRSRSKGKSMRSHCISENCISIISLLSLLALRSSHSTNGSLPSLGFLYCMWPMIYTVCGQPTFRVAISSCHSWHISLLRVYFPPLESKKSSAMAMGTCYEVYEQLVVLSTCHFFPAGSPLPNRIGMLRRRPRYRHQGVF
jgi:hypothetical protein